LIWQKHLTAVTITEKRLSLKDDDAGSAQIRDNEIYFGGGFNSHRTFTITQRPLYFATCK